MSAIKVSIADVEAMAFDDYYGDLTVVDIGDWVSDGKYENCTVVFTDGERYYRATATRSGSYFTDYTYTSEWDDGDAKLLEVRKVAKTIEVWEAV